jgi:hypothetical protein
MKFMLSEINALPTITHDSKQDTANILGTIEKRIAWRNHVRSKNWGGNWTAIAIDPITENVKQDLIDFRNQLADHVGSFKLMRYTNWGYFYTNDLSLISTLSKLPYLKSKSYQRCLVTRPLDTIARRDSKWAFRSYTRYKKLSTKEKTALGTFFHHNHDDVRMSRSMQEFFDGNYAAIFDYFFFDYNHQGILSMVDIMCPGLIRKTKKIIPAK